VLLECLPGFWQAAGPNRLTLPSNLPSSAAARLQATMNGACGATLSGVVVVCVWGGDSFVHGEVLELHGVKL
jgi:hypothetical protein